MGFNNKVSVEEKVKYINEYLKGEITIMAIASVTDCHRGEVMKWVNRYQALGVEGLQPKKRLYTKELKDQVAREYLEGKGSYEVLSNKYDLSSSSVVMDWVKKYQSKEGNLGFNPEKKKEYPKKKLTIEDKREIVKYYFDNGKSLIKTSNYFQIYYHQIDYVIKGYAKHGEQYIINAIKRNHKMNENEKLKKENQLLKIEIEILKKKNQIEEEMISAERGKKCITKQ